MNIHDDFDGVNKAKIYACISASFKINGLKHFVAATHYEYNNKDMLGFNNIDLQMSFGDWKRILIVKIQREAPFLYDTTEGGRVFNIRAPLRLFSAILTGLDGEPRVPEFAHLALNSTLFIFEEIEWKEVVDLIKKCNAMLTGGAPTKRHIISPVQARLVMFLIAVKGLGIKSFYESFHEISGTKTMGSVSKDFPINKYKGKKDRNWDFVESGGKTVEVFSSLHHKFQTIFCDEYNYQFRK